MKRPPGNRGHKGNWRDVVSWKWTPHASLRKFGSQVDDSATATTRQMLNTLKALAEEFDLERVEFDGWVITFRDTSKDGARNSCKSSGENPNFTRRTLFQKRQKQRSVRLGIEQREAERWIRRFAEAGRMSDASGKWVPPCEYTDLRRQVKSWKRYNMRLKNEWRNPQEETKLEDVVAEVEEASGQELKRAKVEDQKEAMKIEGGDVTQDRFMEEEDTVVMEITEAARDVRVVSDDKKCDAERVDAVSDGEEPPAGQEGFVQQLAKQEAVPRASEQKVIDEDDEQGPNLIKDQFYNDFRDQLIKTFQMHGGAELSDE